MSKGNTTSIQEEDLIMLWHTRLGHVFEKDLGYLSKKDALVDKLFHSLRFREYCILGKQTRIMLNKGSHNSKHNLDYIHFDLCGLVFTQSLRWVYEFNIFHI